ncbi:MAG: 3-deoxy-manno-octulosonate cytidylyltransferase [Bacteroidetes bacterium]|nr:3-deoxy-manno-octulosonate cytidylyltransferase [Bacteroidota bacterium]
MKILGIIPARYDSSRFPGKPLVLINGKTMISRVYEQAMKCSELTKVVVATDNETIWNHVQSFGGKAMITSIQHRSGTERCQEVVDNLASAEEPFDFVINIQGDEPYIAPKQISQLAHCIINSRFSLATLIKKITSSEDLDNPNVVKVVTGTSGQALYFSRSAIPFSRGCVKNNWLNCADYYKHIGIYGYQPAALKQIVAFPVSKLELAESLEQLRWLSNGLMIQTRETEYESISIDTPADVLKIPAES